MARLCNQGNYVQLPGTWGGDGVSTVPEFTAHAWVLDYDDLVDPDFFQAVISSIAIGILTHLQLHTTNLPPNDVTGVVPIYKDSTVSAVWLPCPPPGKTWRHVAVRGKPGDSYTTENGVKVGGYTSTTSYASTNGGAMRLASGFPSGRFLQGAMYGAAIHYTALTDTQLAELAAATDAADYDTLVLGHNPEGYWKLDDDVTSSTAADSSGNGRDGTYVGGHRHITGPFGGAAADFSVECTGGWHVGSVRLGDITV